MSSTTLEAPVHTTEDIAVVASPLDDSSVAVAAEAAAEQEEAGRKAATKTLNQCVKAFGKGEAAYRAGMLEAGRLAQTYICQRIGLRDNRKAAVSALEGALNQHASDAVDVSRLVKAAAAADLLTQAIGEANVPNVAYSHFRDHYCRLVTTVGSGTASETHILLPGMEEDCAELFLSATTDSLSRDAVGELVADLVRKYAGLADARAAEEAKAAKAKAADLEAEAKAQQADLAEAKRVADELAAKLTTEQDEVKRSELAKAADEARLALAEEQRATIEANNAASLATKDAFNAGKAADLAAKQNAKLNAAPRERQASREATPAPSETAKQGQNLLATGRAATPKDAGQMAAEIIASNADPVTALRAFCLAMCKFDSVPLATKRHINGFITMLDRPAVSVPAPATAAVATQN